MKRFEVKAELKVILTQRDVDEIMAIALDGGITYWCSEAEVVGDYLGECASDQISRGGKLILHNAESEDKWELTLENFAKGVKRFLERGGTYCIDGNGRGLDLCKIDGEAADCIIQYALFNILLY